MEPYQPQDCVHKSAVLWPRFYCLYCLSYCIFALSWNVAFRHSRTTGVLRHESYFRFCSSFTSTFHKVWRYKSFQRVEWSLTIGRQVLAGLSLWTVSCLKVDFRLNVAQSAGGVEMEPRAQEESSQHWDSVPYNDINKVGTEFEVGQFCWRTYKQIRSKQDPIHRTDHRTAEVQIWSISDFQLGETQRTRSWRACWRVTTRRSSPRG